MTTPAFKQITIQGDDAEKFLQNQLTFDLKKLGLSYQPVALANLKGRIDYGLWIKKSDEGQFDMVVSADCAPNLLAHIKKYGAFSKFTTSEPVDIYPCVLDADSDTEEATFSLDEANNSPDAWVARSIATGNYWIVEATQGMFQPQELRLHQRGGVDYDKGCYLGQEVIARIYFKASPKAFLHRVKGQGDAPAAGDSIGKIKIVNAISTADGSGFEALVVARPEQLEESELEILELPEALQASIARDA